MHADLRIVAGREPFISLQCGGAPDVQRGQRLDLALILSLPIPLPRIPQDDWNISKLRDRALNLMALSTPGLKMIPKDCVD